MSIDCATPVKIPTEHINMTVANIIKMRRDDEQADAVSRLLEHKSGTVLFPTGYGKTRTARLAYQAIGGSTLVVTSRTNLLPQ